MSIPTHPKPGSVLDNEDTLIVVIRRGWSPDQIRAAIGAANATVGADVDAATCEYELKSFRYHTAEQRRCDGVGTDFDYYWSTEGWGRSSVEVALVPWDAS